MKITTILFVLLSIICGGCGTTTSNTAPRNGAKAANSAPQPGTQPPPIKDGDYKGSGKVTKINNDLGSVEMDHGDIPGLMPPMKMEFYVSDKAMLSSVAVGDNVDFTILYKGGTETITKLTKK